MENKDLYEKNPMGYIKILDYTTRIGMIGGLTGIIIGGLFNSPDLANWSAFVGALSIGYQSGKLVTTNSFKKSKLEKDVEK